jgi:hypothetical protein
VLCVMLLLLQLLLLLLLLLVELPNVCCASKLQHVFV